MATLTAIVVLCLAIDYFEIKGNYRLLLGWFLLLGTVIGFGFAVVYMLRTPDMDKILWFLLIDIGVSLIFVGVAIFCLLLLVKSHSGTMKNEAETSIRDNGHKSWQLREE